MIQKNKKTQDIVLFLHHIINQKDLLKPNQSMILAISGGQDSIILFFIFLQLREQWNWRYQLIYCNHLWQRDSFYTILHLFKLAYLFNIPIVFTFTLQKVLTEQLARDWRALTFQRITEFFLVTTLVLGHSKSDRVETGLFNLFRGSSTKGVSSLNWNSLVLKSSIQNLFFLNKFSEFNIRSIPYAETGFDISVVDKKRYFLKKNNQSVSDFSGKKTKTKVLCSFLLLKSLERFIGSLGSAVTTKQQKTILKGKWFDNQTNRKKIKQTKIPNNPSSQIKTFSTPFATWLPCLVDLQPIFLLNQYEKQFLKIKPLINSWEKGILRSEPRTLIFLFLYHTNLSVKCFTQGFVRNFLQESQDLVIKRSLLYKHVSMKCKTRSCSGYVFNLSLQYDPYKPYPFNTLFSPTPFFNRRALVSQKVFLRRFVETVLNQEALPKFLEERPLNLLTDIKKERTDIKKEIKEVGRDHSQRNNLSLLRLKMVLTKMKTRRLPFLLFSYKGFLPISYKSQKVLVRPFLSLTRFDLKKLCNDWKIPLFPDQSNQKLKYQRNRIRKQILPLLRFLFNPQIDTTLNQFIEIINSELYYMDFITCRIVKTLQYKRVGGDQSLFAVLPIPFRRKVIKQFLEDILKKTTRFFDIEKFLQKKQVQKEKTNPNTSNTLLLRFNDDWLPYFTLFFGAKSGQALPFCDKKQVEKTDQHQSRHIGVYIKEFLYKSQDEKCWYQASKNRSEQRCDLWYPISEYNQRKSFLWLMISVFGFFLFSYKSTLTSNALTNPKSKTKRSRS